MAKFLVQASSCWRNTHPYLALLQTPQNIIFIPPPWKWNCFLWFSYLSAIVLDSYTNDDRWTCFYRVETIWKRRKIRKTSILGVQMFCMFSKLVGLQTSDSSDSSEICFSLYSSHFSLWQFPPGYRKTVLVLQQWRFHGPMHCKKQFLVTQYSYTKEGFLVQSTHTKGESRVAWLYKVTTLGR